MLDPTAATIMVYGVIVVMMYMMLDIAEHSVVIPEEEPEPDEPTLLNPDGTLPEEP